MALHQVIRAELGVVWGGSLGVARFRRGRREGIGGVDEVLMPMYTTEFYYFNLDICDSLECDYGPIL